MKSQNLIGTILLLLVPNTCTAAKLLYGKQIVSARQSRIGPSVYSQGTVSGFLIPIADGCTARHPSNSPPHTPDTFGGAAEATALPSPWIALVRRGGGCLFSAAIRAMQTSGAVAVVVGDEHSDKRLISMVPANDEDVRDIRVPSVFVGSAITELAKATSTLSLEPPPTCPSAYLYPETIPLCPLIPNHSLLRVTLVPSPLQDNLFAHIAVVLFVLSPLIVPMLFLVFDTFLRPAKKAAKLPLKIWCEQDQILLADHSTCSICLDEFLLGDSIRLLHCNHWFHTHCVDAWLVQRSPTCPLCKLCIFTTAPASTSFHLKRPHSKEIFTDLVVPTSFVDYAEEDDLSGSEFELEEGVPQIVPSAFSSFH
ncbi:hypothetical protein BCR33DRAFT_712388 [Rhizoclosmatium globosum]|uniref:RING-type domain-containing protein n=1 Tax=Rhizoclosmatium globosum TaxID=329046 RepID=A0A1Y2CW81_9FUNG|nr:hypothetical protein BCR33DRAFT_712388 [Rhizoclosmatium globosum]|eukprot:ORY51290.1 hypothetical protein BCR33DRAFT_712388 [Rhizoclosmatium globosum]